MPYVKHKHRPCSCGCGELADECMNPRSAGLGAFVTQSECTCAMTESSMRTCSVHGEDEWRHGR